MSPCNRVKFYVDGRVSYSWPPFRTITIMLSKSYSKDRQSSVGNSSASAHQPLRILCHALSITRTFIGSFLEASSLRSHYQPGLDASTNHAQNWDSLRAVVGFLSHAHLRSVSFPIVSCMIRSQPPLLPCKSPSSRIRASLSLLFEISRLRRSRVRRRIPIWFRHRSRH